MRRRLAFASTLVALLLVFALPATTLGATYTYQVKKNVCTVSGGSHGFGHLYFKVKLTEWGNSGANKFTFTAKAQHRNLGGSRWKTAYKFGTFTYNFLSNGSSYNYVRWYTYDPADFAWHRIKVVLKVWHNGSLLAKRTLYGKDC